MVRIACLNLVALRTLLIVFTLGRLLKVISPYRLQRLQPLSCAPFRTLSFRMMTSSKNQEHSLVPEEVAKHFLQRELGRDVDVDSSQILAVRSSLLQWYHSNRRLLPWRGDTIEIDAPKTSDENTSATSSKKKNNLVKDLECTPKVTVIPPPRSAYGTWISEIMLQQTRVETVIPYWLRWMNRFPTLQALASSSSDDVNAMWAGLGYYRRAQQLLKGAQRVVSDFSGVIPGTVTELRKIDGIGPYTAGAISSIAFNQVAPLVDGNVIRVLSRLYALKEAVGSSAIEKVSWSIAGQLVDIESPGDFNQGLMELGATVCKPTSPSCPLCPVKDLCRARILLDYSDRIKGQGEGMVISADIDNLKKDDNKAKNTTTKSKKKIIIEHDIPQTENEKIGDNIPGLNALGYPRSISYFPQKKCKKKAKEINFSVLVFRRNNSDHEVKNENKSKKNNKTNSKIKHEGDGEQEEGEEEFLFIRRPDNNGLLANQWEFPNIIIPDRNEREEKKNENDENDEDGEDGDDNDDIQDIKAQSVSNNNDIILFLRQTLGLEWEQYTGNGLSEKKGKTLEKKGKEKGKISDFFSRSPSASSSSSFSSSSSSSLPTSASSTSSSSSSSSSISVSDIVDLTEDSVKGNVNGRKRKIATVCDRETKSDINTNNGASNIDGKDANINCKLISSSPCVILPPILHIFSHERHNMNIMLNKVTIERNTTKIENKIESRIENKIDNKIENELKKDRGKVGKKVQKAGAIKVEKMIGIEITEDMKVESHFNGQSWLSFCGSSREIRWMTKDQIMLAGITTGCKKVLQEALKN